MANIHNHDKRLNHITVVPNGSMPDYQNAPGFVAMVERARIKLKKIGLPKGWEKKKAH